jgi:hypothetical protein
MSFQYAIRYLAVIIKCMKLLLIKVLQAFSREVQWPLYFCYSNEK